MALSPRRPATWPQPTNATWPPMREVAAGQREIDLDRAEFTGADGGYWEHWPERRDASVDRTHSKEDRSASRDDRIALSGNDDASDEEQG